MSDVTESVDVNVPVSTAYRQWNQFESFPHFMKGVESVTQTDDRRTHWVTRVGGARREFDAEITEQRPNERIAWRSVGGDLGHAGVVVFRRLSAERTRVIVHLVWKPQGLAEKVGSILNLDDHQIKADTKRFKEFVEQQGAETARFRGDRPAPEVQRAVQDAAQDAVQDAVQDSDIVKVLLGQHEEIKRRFTLLQSATGEDQARLFDELADLLRTHEAGEQQVVRLVARQDTAEGKLIAVDRIEEEQRVEQALGELKTLGVDHPEFAVKLDTLRRAVLAHAAAEEEQEFPRLSELPPHRRAAMAEELGTVQSAPITK